MPWNVIHRLWKPLLSMRSCLVWQEMRNPSRSFHHALSQGGSMGGRPSIIAFTGRCFVSEDFCNSSYTDRCCRVGNETAHSWTTRFVTRLAVHEDMYAQQFLSDGNHVLRWASSDESNMESSPEEKNLAYLSREPLITRQNKARLSPLGPYWSATENAFGDFKLEVDGKRPKSLLPLLSGHPQHVVRHFKPAMLITSILRPFWLASFFERQAWQVQESYYAEMLIENSAVLAFLRRSTSPILQYSFSAVEVAHQSCRVDNMLTNSANFGLLLHPSRASARQRVFTYHHILPLQWVRNVSSCHFLIKWAWGWGWGCYVPL